MELTPSVGYGRWQKHPCTEGLIFHVRLYWRFWREWPAGWRQVVAVHRERH